jgi:predicted amidohydrolase
MKLSIAQLIVGRDLTENQARMQAIIEKTESDQWIVFPEGVLSGYFPDDDHFMSCLDARRIETAIREVESMIVARKCNCIFGSATLADGAWRNSVLTITRDGQRHTYNKIELSGLDRRHFKPGTVSEVIRVGDLTIGVLACRELLFPGIWSKLKEAGAQIVFHINNAIQPHDRIWNHIMITRSIEQGIFVCSVNNGSPPQELASYLVAPSGKVLIQTGTCRDDFASATINPDDAIPVLANRTDF